MAAGSAASPSRARNRPSTGSGRCRPTCSARTTGTSLEVVAPEFEGAAASEVFYRVVAVDAAGTRSGPSDYAELPHPYFFSVPVTTAATGERYEYRLRSLASMGDLQFRTLPDGRQDRSFSAGDHQRFRLVAAPAWLAVDEESGARHRDAAGRRPVSRGGRSLQPLRGPGASRMGGRGCAPSRDSRPPAGTPLRQARSDRPVRQ
jgi:hypothetical protein